MPLNSSTALSFDKKLKQLISIAQLPLTFALSALTVKHLAWLNSNEFLTSLFGQIVIEKLLLL